jgi:hypothetical protein
MEMGVTEGEHARVVKLDEMAPRPSPAELVAYARV